MLNVFPVEPESLEMEQLIEKSGKFMGESFSFQKLFLGLLKINQKVFQNYLENFSGYNHDVRDISLAYFHFFTKLSINPYDTRKVQNDYLDFLMSRQKLFETIFIGAGTEHQQGTLATESDKRFSSGEWNKYPYNHFLWRNYKLTEQFVTKVLDEVEMSDERRKKLKFYTRHYLYLASPANFLYTNPEALELAFKTNGESLWKGFNNFLGDLEKGKITQTDNSAFEVGKNIAITPGAVIYENELIQLIQYAPTTEKVYEIPVLIIPPWINKFYILDLQPENSFVKFLTEQGITVFIISWRNPMPGMGNIAFDDYVEQGVLSSIEAVQEITKVQKINTLGYCLGGTLLAVAASILKARKKEVINSITFLAAMIDFTDIGPMGDVIDSALVKKLERGELLKDGVMHGYDMEKAFNLIRANDLVWSYVVNNYLKGLSPKALDVMYWTNDNTNLPSKMYLFYMKHIIFKNKLSQKNALRICGNLVDVSEMDMPVYVIAFKEDHISPPATAFTTTELVSGPVEFILGESGHVMGTINPPSKKKYGHFMDGKLRYGYGEWQKTAHHSEVSWWLTWSKKLGQQSGNKTPAPKQPGNKKYPVIEPAPGRYVKEKCSECFVNKSENG